MKVRIAIEQEYDIDDDNLFLDDDPFFDENQESYDTPEKRVDLLVNRFLEDIDYLVKYNEVEQALTVEYIEE